MTIQQQRRMLASIFEMDSTITERPATSLETIRLLEACADGILDDVKLHIANGADATTLETSEEASPLVVAILYEHLDIAKWLVSNSGQRVDVTAQQNRALRAAVRSGDLKMLEWLVFDSHTALQHNSAWTGHPIPKIDVSDFDNRIPQWAVFYQQFGSLRWLLLESGQLAKILSKNLDWLSNAPKDLREVVKKASIVDAFLRSQKLPIEEREHYLQNPVCYPAIVAHFVETLADLDQLFKKNLSATKCRI